MTTLIASSEMSRACEPGEPVVDLGSDLARTARGGLAGPTHPSFLTRAENVSFNPSFIPLRVPRWKVSNWLRYRITLCYTLPLQSPFCHRSRCLLCVGREGGRSERPTSLSSSSLRTRLRNTTLRTFFRLLLKDFCRTVVRE